MRRYLKWAAAVAAIVAGAWIIMQVGALAANQQASRADRADLRTALLQTRADLEDESTASQALADQVESLGEEPVVQPGSVPQSSALLPIPGVRGPGPSFAQVLLGVQASIGDGLREVCGGSCEAEDGTDGTDGADSTVPGPEGPASTIPGTDGTDGTDGRDGTNGTNGTDGRGVDRFDCIDGAIVATYTDDTTQTIPGLTCITPITPTPEETP